MIAIKAVSKVILACLALFLLAPQLLSQPKVAYETKISGLSAPMDIVNAGDGSNRLFVVQRGGVIKVYNGESFAFLGDFLTVTGIGTTGEGGLLSMAFHPDYKTNGFFYVYYTLPDLSLEIARYQVSAGNVNMANPGSKRVVLNIEHPDESNHNGGKILFGPNDGYLYLATGDGGGGGDPNNNAQNGNSLLGKMLRINVTTSGVAPFYTVPPDNPYITPGDNIRDEIWAIGLRNPFRWSFDRANGDMWIADVGQSRWEEINYRPGGATGGINYGWSCREGLVAYKSCQQPPSFIDPIFTYGNAQGTGNRSVTGGFVYRGVEFSSLRGSYIFADYLSGNQWITQSDGAGGWTTQQLSDATLPAGQKFPRGVVAFGEAENGTLYAVSLNAGTVSKIIDPEALPVTFGAVSATLKNNILLIKWTAESETNNSHFEIEGSADGKNFITLQKVNSKAVDGNSNSPISYEVQLDENAWGALHGLTFMAMLAFAVSALAKRKKMLVPAAVLLAFIVAYACNKREAVEDTPDIKLQIRIAQVDKDGKKEYSKTVTAVKE